MHFFFWAADVSNLGRSQLCSVWNMELDLWMNKIQDRVEEVCCTKCFIISVMSFHVYFIKRFHKKLKKNKASQKYLKAWILLNQTCTKKQTRAAAFRHTIHYFFSLNNSDVLTMDRNSSFLCPVHFLPEYCFFFF